MLPFNPFPGFKWVLLALCCAFGLLRPEAAYVSVVWFGFASFYICNKLSLRFVGKPFDLPSKSGRNDNIHPFGLLLLIPFFAGTIYPAVWLRDFVEQIRGYLLN